MLLLTEFLVTQFPDPLNLVQEGLRHFFAEIIHTFEFQLANAMSWRGKLCLVHEF